MPTTEKKEFILFVCFCCKIIIFIGFSCAFLDTFVNVFFFPFYNSFYYCFFLLNKMSWRYEIFTYGCVPVRITKCNDHFCFGLYLELIRDLETPSTNKQHFYHKAFILQYLTPCFRYFSMIFFYVRIKTF